MEEILNKIEQGHRFYISFENRNCTVGKTHIVTDGVFNIDYSFSGDVLVELQRLFNEYYYSTPSERSESNKFTYFKACDDLDITVIINREVKRFELELFMLWIISNNKWEDLFGDKYFFKGDNGLVVLRNWWNGTKE